MISAAMGCCCVTSPKRPVKHETAARRRFAHELAEGLRVIFKDNFFRTTTLSTAVSNFFVAGQYALTVVFRWHNYQLTGRVDRP